MNYQRTNIEVVAVILSTLYKCFRPGWRKFDITHGGYTLVCMVIFIASLILTMMFLGIYFFQWTAVLYFLFFYFLLLFAFVAAMGSVHYCEIIAFEKS